ncbi:MAG: site-specific integrase [Synechocystis sp.]|nr:site-specific integrase [Synechocystis sp.]
MENPNIIPTTLYDAIMGFSVSKDVIKNPKLFGNLKTALKKYSLPAWGYIGEASLEEKLLEIPVKKAKNIVADFAALEEPLLAKGISVGTYNNYKSSINRFDSWMRLEPWYYQAMETFDGKFCPKVNVGDTVDMKMKGRKSKSGRPYFLKKEQLTPKLQSQINELHRFLTAPMVSKRKGKAIREVSFQNYKNNCLSFLGWLHNIEKVPIEDLDLLLMVDDNSDFPRDTLDNYIEWGINEKGNGYAWAINASCAALNIAKCFRGKASKMALFRDIEEVELIRAKINELDKSLKSSESRLNLSEKLIEFCDLQKCLKYLRLCTAPYDAHKNKRTLNAICQSWQRYLVISYLAYVPVRQREIRELELGVTLFKVNGKYLVKLSPDQQKNGSKTGKGREYYLPDFLAEELDYWLNVLRPQLGIETNFVFCGLCLRFPESYGKPFTGSNFGKLVKTAMYRATLTALGEAKYPTPHDFRRIAITHQRQHGDPSQQKGLAELMGHRLEEADRVYDQTTSLQKTSQANNWWEDKPTHNSVNPAPAQPPIPKLPTPKKEEE